MWSSANRVELRRGYTQLQAISGALSSCVPLVYFTAMFDNPEEAECKHNEYKSRVDYEERQAKSKMNEGIG